MNRRTLLLLSFLTLLLLVAAAFTLLDFRVQEAEMNVESSLSTYSFGENEAGTGGQPRPLDLYVQIPSAFKAEMVAALEAALETNPYVAQVHLQEAAPAASDETVLVVSMEDTQSLAWTPVYAEALLVVDVAYASDGEVDWIGEQVVTIEQHDHEPFERVVRARGEYQFDNSAKGLLSRPGYRHYLATEVAETVNQALTDALASQYDILSQN